MSTGYFLALINNLSETFAAEFIDTHVANILSYYFIAIIIAQVVKALNRYDYYQETSGIDMDIVHKDAGKDIDTLTYREKEIFSILCQGKSNKEIAETLFISENTTRNHVANVYKKLGVKSRDELLGARVEG